MARFAVITPVLNGSRFIRDTLASVRNQSEQDWVHYIVDGGSIDGTLEILRDAAAEDSRRRIITGSDRGIYDAGFKGIEAATMDGVINPRTVFSWIGSDDLLMPWAFSTLRSHFDKDGTDWVTALPAIFDDAGRLEIVQPFNWYPRRLIRAGYFHNRCLGTIQTESVFFSQRLLSKVPVAVIDQIRIKRLAGDFMLWREFSRHTKLVPISTAVSGFRFHGANQSTAQIEGYYREIRDSGVRIPPLWLGRILRVGFSQLALAAGGFAFRKAWRDFNARRLQLHSGQRAPDAWTTRPEVE